VPGNNSTDEYWSWTPPGGAAVSLHQYAWSIATFGGSRFGLPTLRGQNVTVAYRAGQQQRAKYSDQRTISLVMFVAGMQQPASGAIPGADQRLTFNNNWQQLRQLFWNPGADGSQQGKLTRQWYITQAGVTGLVTANAMGEVAGSMDPTMTGRYRADFTVDVLLSDPFFYGGTVSKSVPYNSTTTVTNPGEATAGEGYFSAVNSYTITFNGPLHNPLLTNSTNGCAVQLGMILGGGYNVVLDILNFQATDSLAANQIAAVAHAGSRTWLPLAPGANSLLLTSTSGGDTGSCLVQFNPPYV
jgi:hypothetical protein